MEYMNVYVVLAICAFVVVNVHASNGGGLDFFEIATKYGYVGQEYTVITEDGYKIKIYRISGKIKLPVLLVHGIFDSSDTWIARENGSLAITLANKGYDVWIANCRGNRYGRDHVYLNPEHDQFWNFTFHEIGYYDLPAVIDTVLNHTKSKKVNAIGHSQGNTIFYVLASTRPEYITKVNVLMALSPICFLHHIEPPLSVLIKVAPSLYQVSKLLDLKELFGDDSAIISTWRTICPIPVVGYAACIQSIIFPLIGYDEEELEPGYVPTLVKYFPNGSSTKNPYHFAQIALRKTFARFNYGTEMNIAMYNSSEPPEYDLNSVRFKVALFAGANDKVSTLKDVALLRERLPNVVKYLVIPRTKMNHADFILGRHMDQYLYPYLLDFLKKSEE